MRINRFLANIDSIPRQNNFSVNIYSPPALGGESNRLFGPLMQTNLWETVKINPLGLSEGDTDKPALASPTYTQQGFSIRGIRCTNLVLPGRSFITTPHSHFAGGPKTNRINGIDYEGGQIQCTFLLDHSMMDKEKLELWQEFIFDNSYYYQYYQDYIGRMEIMQLGNDNQPIYSVNLEEVFPTALAAQTLDASQTVPQTFTVTFAYRHWWSEYDNSPSGLLGGLFNKVSRKIQSKIDEKVDDAVVDLEDKLNIRKKLDNLLDF